MSNYPHLAKRRIDALIEVLEPLVKRDPEQEIKGIAVPVFEAALEAIREAIVGDPVVDAMVGAYEHEIETGEPVRCADALLVAKQLFAVIGRPPMAWGIA